MTQFTVDSSSSSGAKAGQTLTQSSTSGSGTGFTLTLDADNVGGEAATTSDALLAPGERLLFIDNDYVSVIQVSGGSTGIIRITEAVVVH